jgi:hypothetical protein
MLAVVCEEQRLYPAHKREFLAPKWAVTDKFHDYLYGSKFEVKTDNNPLTFICDKAKLDAVGHRWVASLSNHDFNLTYIAGRLMSMLILCQEYTQKPNRCFMML